MGRSLLGGGGFYGWIVLATTALVFFMGAGSLMSFGVFLPSICEEFGWSRGLVSGAYMAAFAVAGLCSPLVGWFVRKFGASRAIISGGFLGSLGVLLLSFQSHLWQFYLAYGLLIGLGVGLGGFIPTTTLATDWFQRRRSLALGILIASGGLGGLVLIPGLMALIDVVQWRATYLIMAAGGLVFMVVIPGLVLRNKPEDLGQVPDGGPSSVAAEAIEKTHHIPAEFTVGEAIRTKTFWLLTAFGLAHMFALTMIVSHEVAFLVDMGIGAAAAAATFSLVPGLMTVGKLSAGFLGLRFSIRGVAFGATVLTAAATTAISMANTLPIVVAANILFGIGTGAAWVAVTTLYPAYFGRNDYPRTIGTALPFWKILGGLAAPFAGVFHDVTGSYTVPFTVAIILLAGALACISMAVPPSRAQSRFEPGCQAAL
ncbi:MAG: MFS transporter [Gammaproteobacteria bacterium]|nr:MAG: MFS transporter [Gammaproteobacteria bacterium]